MKLASRSASALRHIERMIMMTNERMQLLMARNDRIMAIADAKSNFLIAESIGYTTSVHFCFYAAIKSLAVVIKLLVWTG